VLYQGDEIGLADTMITAEDLRDPVGLRFWPAYAGRDPVRTPMQWENRPGGGFTTAPARPWLPLGDVAAFNVHEQREHPESILLLCRDLIALRRATPDLQAGPYSSLPSPPGVWAWRRGQQVAVAVNLSDAEATIGTDRAQGRIAIATNRSRDDEAVSGPLRLGPWEGAVVVNS
jgi:alpha-glucosidase